jgi:ATP-dependent Clp protease adaptor protein ClpS
MSDNDKRGGDGPNTGVVVKARPKTRKPAMYKVAETKVTQVMDLARQNQHPLQCTIEKE